jgi:hypothetical protein
MGINRTGGCIKKIGKPRSGVQDVSQEEIGEKRAVTVTENVKGAAGAETPLAQKEENGQQNPAERKGETGEVPFSSFVLFFLSSVSFVVLLGCD